MSGSPSLLVVISDRLSDLIKKGEITDRYYNPGEVFKKVTLLLTNDDRPPLNELQRTVGTADLEIVNVPMPSFSRSLGWHKYFLEGWARRGLEAARRQDPDVIRTYGNRADGFLAVQIKKELKKPLLVSLHINPDVDVRSTSAWWRTIKDRIMAVRTKSFERETLRSADWVLPVYEPIRSYAEKYGARKIKVCYNVLNSRLTKKSSYQLKRPAQIVTVGRQIKEKDPAPLMEAVAKLPAVLTLVGDGPEHQRLKRLAERLGGPMRFSFIKSLPNDDLCRRLPGFDLFAVNTQYFEISKAVLEAALSGLPVVVSRRAGQPVPELEGNWVRLVEPTAAGFENALRDLIVNQDERERLGSRIFEHAQRLYSPEKTEKVYADLYRGVLNP